jgi:hypothetical protein
MTEHELTLARLQHWRDGIRLQTWATWMRTALAIEESLRLIEAADNALRGELWIDRGSTSD